MMIERILIPTDGSKGSEKAVGIALDMADRNDAKVYTLSVVDTAPADWDPTVVSSVVDLVKAEAEKAVEQVIEQGERAGISVEGEVGRNSMAHEEILSFAREKGIDLIVMGTHGRSGIDRFLLGSTTERVVRSSPIPVLTVPISDVGEE